MSAVPSPRELPAFLSQSSPQYRPSTINTNIVPWYFPLLPHTGITLESTALFSPMFSASFWSPKPSAILLQARGPGDICILPVHFTASLPADVILAKFKAISTPESHLHILRILQTLQECARLNIYHHKFPVTIPQPLPQPSILQLAGDPMTPQSRLLPPLTLKGCMKKGKHYLMLIGKVWLILSLYLISSSHSLGDIINEWAYRFVFLHGSLFRGTSSVQCSSMQIPCLWVPTYHLSHAAENRRIFSRLATKDWEAPAASISRHTCSCTSPSPS